MNLTPAGWRRVLPFVAFMVLLAVRGYWSELGLDALDQRWIYGLTLPIVGGMLLWWWRDYGELHRVNWPTAGEVLVSVLVGAAVFYAWIHLDAPWMHIGEPAASFVPLDEAGQLILPLVILRWMGAALVVPVMEELFWRSFLMRWVDRPVFEGVDPRQTSLKAVALSTFVFMLAHPLWLAAIVAGLAYALLYRQTGRLANAVIAHAVTNGMLGVWVVHNAQWQFW